MNASSLPRWIDIGLLPVLNLIAALTVAGVIIAIIGENPFIAMGVMIKGAFVYDGALGYTLFYTTNLSLQALLWLSHFMQCCLISAVKGRR